MQRINEKTTLGQEVIKTLLYFDIFNYPLKRQEVFHFLPVNTTQRDVDLCLESLAEAKMIFRFDDFYSLQDDHHNVQRRIRGNAEANRLVKVAKFKATFIASFPFVRAVMASGSLSKGYMDENSDLDFFIVTEPGRLWIARTILAVYKKIFLLNSHKEFCVNYFVDSDHLEIEEKNIFTATELATLIPLYNYDCYSRLHNSNLWLRRFFPNFEWRDRGRNSKKETTAADKMIEGALNLFGDRLDNFFMKLTLARWKRLYGKSFAESDFKIAFKTKKYASKNHPKHYQKKILDLYLVRLSDYKHYFTQLSNYG